MSVNQQISKLSGSEPPRYPNNQYQCMKDFYEFKEKKPDRVTSYINSFIRNFRTSENNLVNLGALEGQLEKVNKLIM